MRVFCRVKPLESATCDFPGSNEAFEAAWAGLGAVDSAQGQLQSIVDFPQKNLALGKDHTHQTLELLNGKKDGKGRSLFSFDQVFLPESSQS